MKKLAFVMGISGNLAFAAANVAIGLNKHVKDVDYDIVIYYLSLEPQDKAALELISNVVLVKYEFNQELEVCLRENLPEECRFRTRERLMCFAHYDSFLLLADYESVVWLDADILVQEDISDCIDMGPIGLCSDEGYSVANQFVEIPDDKYDYAKPGVRIGIMILNNKLPYRQIYDWCIANTFKYVKYLKNPEQAVINLMLQEFSMSNNEIPVGWHEDARSRYASVSKIIHFGTEEKVWNTQLLLDCYPEWHRNNLEWLKLGGTCSKDFTLTDCTAGSCYYQIKDKCDYIFPFGRVRKDSRILIYGYGNIGKWYQNQIEKTDYCKLLAFIDKNADSIKLDSYPIYKLEEINTINEFDYIVIAIADDKIAGRVKQSIIDKGIDSDKIISPN